MNLQTVKSQLARHAQISLRTKLALLLVQLAVAPSAWSLDYVFTTDSDFQTGIASDVTPNNDQIQLSQTSTTNPTLWISNAGEDSVSKINTQTHQEEARYKTWFGQTTHSALSGASPSRTAVDADGNVYVANRHFGGMGDNQPALVLKILAEGGIDRNGNGVIDTSVDSNGDGVIDGAEILVLSDANGNGQLDSAELLDERVAWAVPVGPVNGLGRALCLDNEGDVWLGLYAAQSYYELDSQTGQIKSGPIANNNTNYGCRVDANGKLWSSSLSSQLSELDTQTHAVTSHTHDSLGKNAGIALGNGKVYLASYDSQAYLEFDPAQSSFSTPAAQTTYTLGIAVDTAGNIVLGRNPIMKFAPDGSVIWSVAHPLGTTAVRGIIADAHNNVWTVNLTDHSISKFDGETGAHLATIPVGQSPYSYGNATSQTAQNTTSLIGDWTVNQDSGHEGTHWSSINWNHEIDAEGSSLVVAARSSETLDGIALATYLPVSKDAVLDLVGRYIEVKVTLSIGDSGNSPVLSDLTIAGPLCDLDDDGDVDKNDTAIIMQNRNQTVPPGDSRLDVNDDGIINGSDARVCVLQCNRPRCAL